MLYTNKIDRVAVFNKISTAADTLLREVSGDAISNFAEESKRILDYSFDQYVLETHDYYTGNNMNSIKDTETLLQFTDVQHGYRKQMRTWVKDNPIAIEERRISVEELPTLPLLERESLRKSALYFVSGNVLIVGLRLLTGAGWIWWLELAAVFLAMKAGVKGHHEDELRILKMRKDIVIKKIIEDMTGWLDAAEKKQQDILATFGISD